MRASAVSLKRSARGFDRLKGTRWNFHDEQRQLRLLLEKKKKTICCPSRPNKNVYCIFTLHKLFANLGKRKSFFINLRSFAVWLALWSYYWSRMFCYTVVHLICFSKDDASWLRWMTGCQLTPCSNTSWLKAKEEGPVQTNHLLLNSWFENWWGLLPNLTPVI